MSEGVEMSNEWQSVARGLRGLRRGGWDCLQVSVGGCAGK